MSEFTTDFKIRDGGFYQLFLQADINSKKKMHCLHSDS